MPEFDLSASALTTLWPVNACNRAARGTSVPIPDRLDSGVKGGGHPIPAGVLDPGWQSPVPGSESHRFAGEDSGRNGVGLAGIRSDQGGADAEMSLWRL
jgi:hypothetical protein